MCRLGDRSSKLERRRDTGEGREVEAGEGREVEAASRVKSLALPNARNTWAGSCTLLQVLQC